ncbi:unnamed protein product, partial [Scytosiphon promiscuus]
AVLDGILLRESETQRTQGARISALDPRIYDCPDEETVEAFDNTTALSLGLGVVTILTGKERAGGDDGSWYEDKLANLLVEFCEEKRRGLHHRYVTSQNATAAKDEYGVCVQALDGDRNIYATGLCERVANCYWEEPRETLERARRYTDGQYEANERAARDYMQSIAVTYGTLGLVLAIVVLIGCTKFAVKRGIYNKCVCDSDLQRDRTGYTDLEQKIPAMIYFVGLVIVIVAGLLGLQGDRSITSGLDLMLTTMDEATQGIEELSSSVSSPLSSFVGSLNASIEEVELLLSTTGAWLGELERGTALRLNSFDSAHRDSFLGRDAEFDVLAAEVEIASADFVAEVVDDVSAVLDILQAKTPNTPRSQRDFLDLTDLMEGQSLNVLAALSLANETALENRNRFAYFRSWSDEYTGVRTTGTQGLVAAVGIAGVMGLLGTAAGLAKNKTCSKCINLLRLTCVVTFPATWIAFVMSSMVIVSAVVWSDGCHFLELAARRGWETAGFDGLSAGVLDGCLRGYSVFEEFNLTDALGFFGSYPTTVEELGALDATLAEADVEDSIHAISDFVFSLNATAVAVSRLDFYTNAEVNGSLLVSPDCGYNVTFEGEEAKAYLGRPWLALPTTALAYMSRVFNSSDCSAVNEDLLSAWVAAARERAYRDQMQDDLTCIWEESGATDCSSSSPLSSLSSSSSSSSSISSTFSLSPCSCTSDSYVAADGLTDTLLAYFRTFAENVTTLRADLADLLTRSLEGGAAERSALANASSNSWEALCASQCSFVESHYRNFESAMCGMALSGLGQVGFSLFLIGSGGLALAISSGVMVHRLKAAWAKDMTKVLSTEEDIVMEEY